ncbi:MAG: superoxide dismutase, Ni [Pseudobacteriovorax sp.]|nr:superoxide dismutase, Ni [Pseudobacteriovorax sp.]
MLSKLINSIESSIPAVAAHCDIPCKIYDPYSAQIAALSVVRMLDLMNELNAKNGNDLTSQNTMTRYIAEKEKQATICKEEIRIIWGDYFKKPQIDSFPVIHELTHNLMMAASAAKQGAERDNGIKLVSLVNDFAEIFWQTKKIDTKKAICPYPPSLEIVYPSL